MVCVIYQRKFQNENIYSSKHVFKSFQQFKLVIKEIIKFNMQIYYYCYLGEPVRILQIPIHRKHLL